MDVRCEKCQTEYELDESRLKPGGVTVKCTQCGHMFKIRKRGATGVSASGASGGYTSDSERTRQISSRPPSAAGVPRALTSDFGSGPSAERIWIIRLDNGESRTCRELGTLQQWILSGLVTRESLISRTGKTWKRLGDIAELATFFQVADEARFQRTGRDSGRITSQVPPEASGPKKTMVGAGARAPGTRPSPSPSAGAGEPKSRSTLVGLPTASAVDLGASSSSAAGAAREAKAGSGKAGASPSAASGPLTQKMSTTPPPGAVVAPIAGQAQTTQKMAAPPGPTKLSTPPPTRAKAATPPPVPMAHAAPRPGTKSVPPPIPSSAPRPSPSIPPDPATAGPSAGAPVVSERSTGAWAAADLPHMGEDSAGLRGPVAGPVGGALRGVSDEPAFAGRGAPSLPPPPSQRSAFSDVSIPRQYIGEETSPVMPPRRGVGTWVAVGSTVVIAAAAVVVYLTVFRGASGAAAASAVVIDAGTGSDAGAIAAAPPDAAGVPALSDAVVAGRNALLSDAAPGLAAAMSSLSGDTSPPAIAMAPRLITALAQALQDEAALTPPTDKKRVEDLTRDARQKLLDAIKPAQRALREAADQPLAHVAMADLLRLQGKPTADVRRHIDRALALAPNDREARLVAALLDLRDGKTQEARTQLLALDQGVDTLEQSGDVRARFRLAMLAQTSGDTGAARSSAEAVLAVASDHTGARALMKRLGEPVTTSDPLPPEDRGGDSAGKPTTSTDKPGTDKAGTDKPGTDKPGADKPASDGGESYDRLLQQANKLAEVDCGRAMPLYEKAIDLRTTGVEALSGAGFCHIDRKEFASAHNKFRAALGVSPRYERALWGVAEAYQQQGRSDLATEAYRHYLEIYPDSAAAKRQLDKLGGAAAPAPAAPTPAAPTGDGPSGN